MRHGNFVRGGHVIDHESDTPVRAEHLALMRQLTEIIEEHISAMRDADDGE